MPSHFNSSQDAPFVVEIEPDPDVVGVRPVGELDFATCPELESVVEDLREAGFTAFRLDLRSLTFIDSCGLRSVLAMVGDEDLAVTVIPGPRGVQRAFEITGLAEVIPFQRPSIIRGVAA